MPGSRLQMIRIYKNLKFFFQTVSIKAGLQKFVLTDSCRSENFRMDDVGATVPSIVKKTLQFTVHKNCASFGLINFISEVLVGEN